MTLPFPACPPIAAIASVPARHPAPMRPQAIEVWTPFSLLGGAVLTLLTLPRQAVPALAVRPRRA